MKAKSDLKKLYNKLEIQQQELQKFFDLLKAYKAPMDESLKRYENLIDDFLSFVGLPKNDETLLAVINRIVNVREDAFLQVIASYDKEQQIQMKERAFLWVSRFYIKRFEELLEWIEKEELFDPFYRSLLKHAHNIGTTFSSWQSSWMAQIIYGINEELYRLFEGDEAKIFEMLLQKDLLDKGHDGECADRCYSVLRMREDGRFERLSYREAFKEEVDEVLKKLTDAIDDLKEKEDTLFDQKEAWLDYFRTLYKALEQTDPDKLVPAWADVDRAWMKITTPLQIGHPLEYYEDIYRKAVALEWDVRIANPDYPVGERAEKIERMFTKVYKDIGIEAPSIFQRCIRNIKRVQLYVGRPMLFYGSEFNGLFSAQVVPNDEVVSKEFGKKIFAYPDMILSSQKAKPKMRLSKVVFGEELAEAIRGLLYQEEQWHKIYDITTIGHEYGHILWMDEDTEVVMNTSGMFKLTEEFKATSGGLMAYFCCETEDLWYELLLDHISRSVSLIGWMEVLEVLPYYVEGLLHLQALFETEIFRFDSKLHIQINKSNYEAWKSWYEQVYKELAKHYLKKLDSASFLDRYISKNGQSYLPKNPEIKSFVEYYYDLYKKIGRMIDR
ncbi:invasion protein CiaB [Nitratiruptor sp. SB155-2]|uniref:invasion protein CiaB n=1 Tax=Nitratiruptor sp. (strain SB155-2) TaxID=387092 RepID=UPI0001587331|nr:invasion protein CiaB [Nitratiruptor sp. SB155-2]BAF70735.1 invasion antigen B [Nitratiruptor sp. SB155-2]